MSSTVVYYVYKKAVPISQTTINTDGSCSMLLLRTTRTACEYTSYTLASPPPFCNLNAQKKSDRAVMLGIKRVIRGKGGGS